MGQKAATILIFAAAICSFISAEDVRFAELLESKGEFERAAVEYLRFEHENAHDPAARLALYRAGRCYERAEKWGMAKGLYLELQTGDIQDSLSDAAIYRTALTKFMLGDLNMALQWTEKAIQLPQLENAASYLDGWIYFYARDYSTAANSFEKIESNGLDSSARFMLSMSEIGETLPVRSPYLAASMSAIVPGLGRAYCGRWGDALVNLIAVGGTIGGAYLLRDEDRSFAVGLAFTGAILYGGNIYGSFTGAKWFNEEKNRELYRDAREQVIRRPEELFDY